MVTVTSDEQYWIDLFRSHPMEFRRLFNTKYGATTFEQFLQLQLKVESYERALLYTIRLFDTMRELKRFTLEGCPGICGQTRENERYFYEALSKLFQVMKPCKDCKKMIASVCCGGDIPGKCCELKDMEPF